MEQQAEQTNKSVYLIALRTAYKTLCFVLCAFVLVSSVLLAALNSSKMYYSLELYQKAFSQIEREHRRAERRLESMYMESVEYQDYALNTYLPLLSRTVDYGIKLLSERKNAYSAKKVLTFAGLYRQRQQVGLISHISRIDQKNILATSGSARLFAYSYNSYISYYEVYASAVLGDSGLSAMGRDSLLELVEGRMQTLYSQTNSSGNSLYNGEYLPDFSIRAYFDHLLEQIDYSFMNYPANILASNVSKEQREAMFDFERFSYEMYYQLLAPSGDIYQYTDLYHYIKGYYQNIKALQTANRTGLASMSLEDALYHVWYVRALHSISYAMCSMFVMQYLYTTYHSRPTQVNAVFTSTATPEMNFWIAEFSGSTFIADLGVLENFN